MKKALIAGAASVALAAMPVVGVFAAGPVGPYVDQINVNIDNNCAFTRQTTKHELGTWTTDQTNTSQENLTAPTLTLGTPTTVGDSNFNVICNNVDGYKITMTPTALNKSTVSGDTNPASIDYAAESAAGKWSVAVEGPTGVDLGTVLTLTDGAATIATSDEGVASTNFKVTYTVYPAADQAAGSYTGTATYNFAQL